MNIIPILLMSLSLQGCAAEIKICKNYPDIDLSSQITDFPVMVNLRSKFTKEDIEKANEAVDEWNDAVGETVFVLNTDTNLDKDGCGYVDVVSHSFTTSTFGHATHTDCSADIKMTNSDDGIHEFFKETLMHELGHAIGLHHEKDINSTMYKYVNSHNRKLSEKSIEYIQQVMHCFD